VRRWARHTPNGEVAALLMGSGALLVFVAVLVAVVAF
jgi:hypothetical protein